MKDVVEVAGLRLPQLENDKVREMPTWHGKAMEKGWAFQAPVF